MNIKKCDICGSCEGVCSKVEINTEILVISDDDQTVQRAKRRYDLCDDCAEWLENRLFERRADNVRN